MAIIIMLICCLNQDYLLIVLLISAITVALIIFLLVFKCVRRNRRNRKKKHMPVVTTTLTDVKDDSSKLNRTESPRTTLPYSEVDTRNNGVDGGGLANANRSVGIGAKEKFPQSSASSKSLSRVAFASDHATRNHGSPVDRVNVPSIRLTCDTPTYEETLDWRYEQPEIVDKSNYQRTAGSGNVQTDTRPDNFVESVCDVPASSPWSSLGAGYVRVVPSPDDVIDEDAAVNDIPDRRPVTPGTPSGTIKREHVIFDWERVDPELLQHCRKTNPVLHKNQYWV